MMERLPDIEILKKTIKKLQKIMFIQDWQIDVQIITSREMAKKYPDEASYDTQAISDRNLRRNYAKISINKEYFCDEDETWYDTLVHEMLHVQETEYIHTAEAYMDENGPFFDDAHEQYIDKLQKMFSNVYPLEKFKEDNPDIFKS